MNEHMNGVTPADLAAASALALKLGKSAQPGRYADYHISLSAALEACMGVRAMLSVVGRSEGQEEQLKLATSKLVQQQIELDRTLDVADKRVVLFHIYLRWQVGAAGAVALATDLTPPAYWEMRRIQAEYALKAVKAQPGSKGFNICRSLSVAYEHLGRALRAARKGDATKANGYLRDAEKLLTPMNGKLFDADAEKVAGWHGEVTFAVAMISHPEA